MAGAIHTRFTLTEVGRTLYYQQECPEAVKVKFAAVQGEPFGPATPQGTIEMLIVNPAVVEMLSNPKSTPLRTEYDVIFTPVAKT